MRYSLREFRDSGALDEDGECRIAKDDGVDWPPKQLLSRSSETTMEMQNLEARLR